MSSKTLQISLPPKPTPDNVLALRAALQAAHDIVMATCLSLDSQGRRELVKMSQRSADFVDKTLVYTRGNSECKPSYVDLDEYADALAIADIFGEFRQPFRQLADMVSDTVLFARAEAYGAARACYGGWREGAKMGRPGAEAIYKELSLHFVTQRPKAVDPETEAEAEMAIEEAGVDSQAK